MWTVEYIRLETDKMHMQRDAVENIEDRSTQYQV